MNVQYAGRTEALHEATVAVCR